MMSNQIIRAFRFDRAALLGGIILILTSVLSLSLSGCSKPQFYEFCVFNRTGAEIKSFTIESQGDHHNFGSPELNGISFSPDGPFIGEMPSKVSCTWQDQTGRIHKSVLSIPPPRKDQGHSTRACFYVFPAQMVKVATFSVIEMRDDAQVKNGFDTIFACNGGPRYEVNVSNRTNETIHDIKVFFGKHCVLKFSELSPYRKDLQQNKHSAPMNHYTDGLPYEITEDAIIVWTDEKGVEHQKTIQLKKQLPADLNNKTISFTIGEQEQTVLSTFPSDEHYSKWFYHNLLTDKGDLNK